MHALLERPWQLKSPGVRLWQVGKVPFGVHLSTTLPYNSMHGLSQVPAPVAIRHKTLGRASTSPRTSRAQGRAGVGAALQTVWLQPTLHSLSLEKVQVAFPAAPLMEDSARFSGEGRFGWWCPPPCWFGSWEQRSPFSGPIPTQTEPRCWSEEVW